MSDTPKDLPGAIAKITALEAQIAQKDAEIASLWQQLEAANMEESMRVVEENNDLKRQVSELNARIKDLEMGVATMTPSLIGAPAPPDALVQPFDIEAPAAPVLAKPAPAPGKPSPAVPDLSAFAEFSSPPPAPPAMKAPTPSAPVPAPPAPVVPKPAVPAPPPAKLAAAPAVPKPAVPAPPPAKLAAAPAMPPKPPAGIPAPPAIPPPAG
ncbi:MAG: hypothetical protein JW839_00910, partial [Candidatus Lokiarchaeota archaeon]|nr:hypothetical protein [Candidatus Lokiarchaeota archaeon]